MNTHPRPRPGFTMVELLVTIAIVIVLAALAFTLSRKGIQSAQSVQCLSNMRQTALSHVALAQENNGVLVHTWKSRAFGSWQRNWAQFHTIAANEDLGWRENPGVVDERMRTLEHLQCPTAAALRKKEMATMGNHDGWRTYALNLKIGRQDDEESDQLAWIDGAETYLQVEEPSKLILLLELAWKGGKYPAGCTPTSTSQPSGFFAEHGGHTHVCYFDGHVAKKKPQHVPVIGATLENGETVTSLNDPEYSLIWRGTSSKK